MTAAPLASGPQGPDALRPLLDTVLDALREGAGARGGPLPAGGPDTITALMRDALGEPLPADGEPDALHRLVRALAAGTADPADPLCAAHLHTPPLAVAAAADLAVSVLNPSLDSWDQAPAASALEALVTRALAAETGAADALVTTGGTESNQLALLLAREAHPGVRLVCGANAHHSLVRAAWLLGLPDPVVIPTPAGTLDPTALDDALTHLQGPLLVAATAGTTDAGLIDPLPALADLCRNHRARLHIDAAYGGGLLFSDRHRPRLDGLTHAHTITLDLHKLGWQPVAAGLLAVRDTTDLTALDQHADYLNADDDTEAGLPDLLGRSLRTTRRPDILKTAVTLKTLDAADSADSSTTSAPSPRSSPPPSKRTPASSSTTGPPSARSSSGPPEPPTPPWQPSAADSSTTAGPSSAAPHSTAGSGSRPPCSTPTPGRTTSPPC